MSLCRLRTHLFPLNRFCVSPNGWIDSELATHYMIKDFDEQTRDKAEGRTRVLLLDGHSSHHTPELLRYAKEHNIIVLGPPHCTHALQGLDVVCFARMKEAWKLEVRAFEERTGRKLGKSEFAEVFGAAFARAFIPQTIQAAFRVTGIFPFDPTVITASQMKPAEATSTTAGFALPQSSPVRAVMAAFHHYQPTALELDEDTHMGPIASGSGHGSPPATQTLRRVRDPNIDPALYTPSKRMRMMTSALAGTASGSFLVSNNPVTSQSSIMHPVLEHVPVLPSPDWGLIQSNCD